MALMPMAEAAPAEDMAPARASVSMRRKSAPLSRAWLSLAEGISRNNTSSVTTQGRESR